MTILQEAVSTLRDAYGDNLTEDERDIIRCFLGDGHHTCLSTPTARAFLRKALDSLLSLRGDFRTTNREAAMEVRKWLEAFRAVD